MKIIVLDTNAYVAMVAGDAEAVAIVKGAPKVGIPFAVRGELLAGFRLGNRESENRQTLSAFLRLPATVCLESDASICDYYAMVVQQLRKKGKPIPANDVWIAATTMAHGGMLFTYDAHFSVIDGLRSGHTVATLLA